MRLSTSVSRTSLEFFVCGMSGNAKEGSKGRQKKAPHLKGNVEDRSGTTTDRKGDDRLYKAAKPSTDRLSGLGGIEA